MARVEKTTSSALAGSIYKSVANVTGEITTQYILRYIPNDDGTNDKTFRELNVKVALPDVKERTALYFEHSARCKEQIQRCARVHRNLVVLDLRDEVKPQIFPLKPVGEYGHRLVLDIFPSRPVDALASVIERGAAPATAIALAQPEAPEPAPSAAPAVEHAVVTAAAMQSAPTTTQVMPLVFIKSFARI